jgi:hypothetical protein
MTVTSLLTNDDRFAVMLKLPILQKLAIFRTLSESPDGIEFVNKYFPATEIVKLTFFVTKHNRNHYELPLPPGTIKRFTTGDDDITSEGLVLLMWKCVYKPFLEKGFTDVFVHHGDDVVIPLLVDAKTTADDIEIALPPSMLKNTHVMFFVKQVYRKQLSDGKLYIRDTDGSFISNHGGMLSLVQYFDKFREKTTCSIYGYQWFENLPIEKFSVVYAKNDPYDERHNHVIFNFRRHPVNDIIVMNRFSAHFAHDLMIHHVRYETQH